MSWTKRVKHPSEVLKKGDEVEAHGAQHRRREPALSLGIKQLATDVWDEFFGRVQVGDVVEGKVVRMTDFGAFVELDEGIEGLIHVSEFDDARRREGRPAGGADLPDEGHQLSPSERKVGLSIRALKGDEYRARLGPVHQRGGSPTATLGDHFRKQRQA